jgi:hypothetical protein
MRAQPGEPRRPESARLGEVVHGEVGDDLEARVAVEHSRGLALGRVDEDQPVSHALGPDRRRRRVQPVCDHLAIQVSAMESGHHAEASIPNSDLTLMDAPALFP